MRLIRTWIGYAVACVVCVAANFGCGSHGRSVATEANALSAPAPATRPATVAADQSWQSVEVRYGGNGKPQALSPEQTEWIFGCAMDTAPPGSRIWFILVLYNTDGHFATEVYFEPTVRTCRMRKGIYAHITSGAQRVRGNSELALAIRARKRQWPEYVQISDEAAPFTDALSIPRLSLMPFDPNSRAIGVPAKLSDEDWVALVDLVRPVFEGRNGGPICRVESYEGVLYVFSGWQEGPLSGGGLLVQVKRKTDGGFELTGEVGSWMS